MSLKTTALLLFVTTALLANASATPLQVNLNFTIAAPFNPMPMPAPVNDPYGLIGSIWTLSYVVDNPVYSSVTTPWDMHSGLVSSSAWLTISGASNAELNGTFNISDSVAHNFLLIPRYSASGNYGVFGLNDNGSNGSFAFDAQNFSLSNLLINSSSPASVPPIGSDATSGDFDGLLVTAGQFMMNSASLGYASYNIQSGGTISSHEVIPEPSTYAVAIAVLALGAVGIRRLKSLPRSLPWIYS